VSASQPRPRPRVFRIGSREALDVRTSPTGEVGRLFTGDGLEAVWVRKEGEEVDPGWFRSPRVDLILVLEGLLRVEFDAPEVPARTLEPGELLVLPPDLGCRAYRWPRDARRPTVFVAVYPQDSPSASSVVRVE
jgi:hypothetical protein